jgi:hypothetical protein
MLAFILLQGQVRPFRSPLVGTLDVFFYAELPADSAVLFANT